MNYEIAIPSYKRPDRCKSAQRLSKAIIYVHEFEADEYRHYNNNEVRVIPDELQGKGMATIRNYILDHSKGDRVLMVDDDLNKFGYYEECEQVIMKEAELYAFIQMAFDMCEEMGTRLWGVNLQSDKKFYREYSPISLSSVILGPFMGIIKDPKIRFDERLGLKEDYDYSLQILNKYRRIMRLNKYHYMSDHIKTAGGCATYRTSEKEERQAALFQKKWGPKIVKIKRNTQGGNQSINPVVTVPINGI